ncbi:unnamed protein product, partial [Laminaria digitata]
QVVSSGYDRTLESASALTLGLYPANQEDPEVAEQTLLWQNFIVVPIHSSKPQNDAVIVATDKCPAYDDNWIEFYRTTTFLEKQQFLAKIFVADGAENFIVEVYRAFSAQNQGTTSPNCWDEAKDLQEHKMELHAPYNLWDCANVLKDAGEFQTMNLIDEATPPDSDTGITAGFEYLTHLTKWIEDEKFQQSVVGRYVGGLYIADMNTRMSEVIKHVRSGRAPTEGRLTGMHVTVGHYPTLKGIAGALDIPQLEGIPDYASHLTFELLHIADADTDNDEDDFAVRILYQN